MPVKSAAASASRAQSGLQRPGVSFTLLQKLLARPKSVYSVVIVEFFSTSVTSEMRSSPLCIVRGGRNLHGGSVAAWVQDPDDIALQNCLYPYKRPQPEGIQVGALDGQPEVPIKGNVQQQDVA